MELCELSMSEILCRQGRQNRERQHARVAGVGFFWSYLESDGVEVVIDYTRFSAAVRRELVTGGWAPERSVDIAEWVEELGEQGYRLNEAADTILHAFGGLSFGPINIDGPNFSNDEPLVVDPILAGFGHRQLAEELEAALGGNWYPVAEWLSSSSVYVEDSGWFVATGMGWIWDLGHSIEEAVEFALMANHPLRCLAVVTPGLRPWPTD